MSATSNYDPDFFPGRWAVNPDAAADAADRKSPPLEVLYPEKDRYLVIAPERYYDPAFMKREWQAIWSKTWLCAGRVSDVARSGDWFKYDVGHESFIVARAADGVLRAFYNVCQHRGRRLVNEEFGNVASFVCGFHSWVYGLDGSSRRVTDREYFTERSLCGDLGLRTVRCDTWGGFVFICMDPAAASLQEFLSDIPEVMAAYRIEDMHVVKDVVVAVNCNWKVATEAFLEPYHTHITHPQILGVVDEVHNQYDFYANGHSRVVTPLSIPSPRLKDRRSLGTALKFVLQAAGIDPATFDGTAADVRAALQAAKRCPDNVFGLDYSAFADGQLVDNWNPALFPNLSFNALPEAVQIMQFRPHATDPTRCYFHVLTLMPKTKPGVRPTAFFGVEEDADLSGTVRPPRQHTTQEAPGIGVVLEQDVSNMPRVQEGVMSAGFSYGVRLSEQEQRIQQLHAEIDRCFAKSEVAAGAGGV